MTMTFGELAEASSSDVRNARYASDDRRAASVCGISSMPGGLSLGRRPRAGAERRCGRSVAVAVLAADRAGRGDHAERRELRHALELLGRLDRAVHVLEEEDRGEAEDQAERERALEVLLHREVEAAAGRLARDRPSGCSMTADPRSRAVTCGLVELLLQRREERPASSRRPCADRCSSRRRRSASALRRAAGRRRCAPKPRAPRRLSSSARARLDGLVVRLPHGRGSRAVCVFSIWSRELLHHRMRLEVLRALLAVVALQPRELVGEPRATSGSLAATDVRDVARSESSAACLS